MQASSTPVGRTSEDPVEEGRKSQITSAGKIAIRENWQLHVSCHLHLVICKIIVHLRKQQSAFRV